MPALTVIGRFAAAVVVFCLVSAPASAEVEKFMHRCANSTQVKLCPFFRPSVIVPEGWAEDKAATRHFKAVMLVPKGVGFNDAQAVIYAVARYNPKKEPVADFVPPAIHEWYSTAHDAKVTALAELPRGEGKAPFTRHRFEAPSLKAQGFELRAVTADADKDGNQFIVTVTLSANSRDALDAAESAYNALLAKY